MNAAVTFPQLILLLLLMASAVGVLYFRNPVHACLSFLFTLLLLSVLYLELKAPFIAVMQVLIYAGAILVIFMFVVVLFQDAHSSIAHYRSKSHPWFLYSIAALFCLAFLTAGWSFITAPIGNAAWPEKFGSVESIGRALYIDFFFPFEIVVLIFLVALIGALYIGKKET